MEEVNTYGSEYQKWLMVCNICGTSGKSGIVEVESLDNSNESNVHRSRKESTSTSSVSIIYEDESESETSEQSAGYFRTHDLNLQHDKPFSVNDSTMLNQIHNEDQEDLNERSATPPIYEGHSENSEVRTTTGSRNNFRGRERERNIARAEHEYSKYFAPCAIFLYIIFVHILGASLIASESQARILSNLEQANKQFRDEIITDMHKENSKMNFMLQEIMKKLGEQESALAMLKANTTKYQEYPKEEIEQMEEQSNQKMDYEKSPNSKTSKNNESNDHFDNPKSHLEKFYALISELKVKMGELRSSLWNKIQSFIERVVKYCQTDIDILDVLVLVLPIPLIYFFITDTFPFALPRNFQNS